MFEPDTRIDKTDPLPRHAQVQRILRNMVSSGQLRPGDKIPAELQIADTLGVSKMTVNKALLALTASGLFVREVGRGTFVAQPQVASRGEEAAFIPAVIPVSSAPRITLSFVEGAKNILDSAYYGTIYRGVADVLEAHQLTEGMSLTATAAGDYLAEERRAPADGRLIIAPRAASVASCQALWDAGRLLVVVGASWPTIGVPSVDSDNIGGAMEAVRYLIDQGHRRIALLYAEGDTANTQDRIVGYRRALLAAGITPRTEWEIPAEGALCTGETALAHWSRLVQDEREPVTAVFAAGHFMALEAMNAVRDAGRRVPEDISVVGYDDPLSAQLAYPPLTTVRQPLYDMGRRAAERLVRLMRGQEERAAVREVLPAQLVIRRSTGRSPRQRSRRARRAVFSRLQSSPQRSGRVHSRTR